MHIKFLLLQTQYIFIHNALDELLTCGDTEVAAANMRIVIGKLSRPAEEESSISGFLKQYEVSNTSIFSRLSFRYWVRSVGRMVERTI